MNKFNNWFIRQRAFMEVWSTWEVWRALKKLEWLSASLFRDLYASFVLSKLPKCFIPRWTHADVWANCFITFSTRWKIFSRGICLLTPWACAIGIWSTLAQYWIWLDKFTSYVIIGLENHFEGRNRIEKSIRTWNVSKSAVWKNRRVGWY